jgi:hypothetical protein
MRVRVLFGRQAGDVVDYPVHTARRLLDEGRAVLPEVSVVVAPEVQAVTTTAPNVWRRKKRR